MTARLGATNPLLLLAAGVGGSGVLAITVFWAYLANPYFGRGAAIVLTAASAVVMAEACHGGITAWKALRSLAPVTALFVASRFFNAAMAYLHERFAYESNPAVNRYLTGLPSDNVLPWFFARQLEAKARPLPMYLVPGWQSSDRPPLQTGYYLMQHAVLGTSNFNDYVLVSILPPFRPVLTSSSASQPASPRSGGSARTSSTSVAQRMTALTASTQP